jgi:translocation and assembly module TamB
VGIHLGGSLKKIEGELFSTPVMPDQEVLAILVTGKSFSSANSQDGDALLTAIANLGIDKGQGITGAVRSGLGLDSVVVSGGANYRDSSLGLGKYLSPNLLVRYDIGLFDRQAVLGLEYTLTEHLRLEVETGISQSADITYTLEKN